MRRVCPSSIRTRQRGGTLIEVLVALLLLGLGLGGFAVSQTRALAVAHEATFMLQATLLAEERVEMARAFGSAGLPSPEHADWRARVEARLPDPSVETIAPAPAKAGEIRITWATAAHSGGPDARVVRHFHP